MPVFDEGKVFLGLLHRDDLGMHAQVAALGHRGFQELHARRRVGQHDPGRQMQAAGLAGDFFQLLVKAHGVALQHGHVRVAVERMKAARRMPGGAGRELVALEQQHVLPALLGQVVEHRAAHHAAADHHHARTRLHRPFPLCLEPWSLN
jgi:hypothetical protein